MESRNLEHVDEQPGRRASVTSPPKKRTPPKKTKSKKERPDALLRHLIEHSVYELAILFARGQYVLYQRDGNLLATKGIGPETLYAAFAAELGDSGWLNPDIMRCGIGPAGSFAVKFVPPRIYRFTFSTGTSTASPLTVNAPLPPLVFAGVNVRDGVNASTYYVWAMQQEVFSPQAVLYHAPFTNVYEEGRICWGENHPPAASKETIDAAWDLFITSLFTGEMGGERSRQHPRDIRGLYLALAGADRYPVDDLLPLVRDRTSYYASPTGPVLINDMVRKYILKEEA